MTQWTHGPWNTSGYLGNVTVTDSQGYVIAHVEYERRERLANARLLALAPEMAEALRACVEVLAVQYHTRQRDGGAGQQAFDRARALLARLDA